MDGLGRDQHIALAVAKLIAKQRDGGNVKVVHVPELEDRQNPAVELITEDDVSRLAIEHTLVESFSDQLKDDVQIRLYATALQEALAGDLPTTSCFVINLNVRTVHGGRERYSVLELIAQWVRQTAPSLVEGRPGVNGRHMARSRTLELPFEVTLVCWPSRDDDSLPNISVGCWLPDDLEDLRETRIAEALLKKLPKIDVATTAGVQGVFILESVDIQLANTVKIRAALQRAAAGQSQRLPAWIAIWETTGDTAFVWLLRADDEWIAEPTAVECTLSTD